MIAIHLTDRKGFMFMVHRVMPHEDASTLMLDYNAMAGVTAEIVKE